MSSKIGICTAEGVEKSASDSVSCATTGDDADGADDSTWFGDATWPRLSARFRRAEPSLTAVAGDGSQLEGRPSLRACVLESSMIACKDASRSDCRMYRCLSDSYFSRSTSVSAASLYITPARVFRILQSATASARAISASAAGMIYARHRSSRRVTAKSFGTGVSSVRPSRSPVIACPAGNQSSTV